MGDYLSYLHPLLETDKRVTKLVTIHSLTARFLLNQNSRLENSDTLFPFPFLPNLQLNIGISRSKSVRDGTRRQQNSNENFEQMER